MHHLILITDMSFMTGSFPSLRKGESIQHNDTSRDKLYQEVSLQSLKHLR